MHSKTTMQNYSGMKLQTSVVHHSKFKRYDGAKYQE